MCHAFPGPSRPGAHRGVVTTPEELEEVADVYKKAFGWGIPVHGCRSRTLRDLEVDSRETDNAGPGCWAAR